MSAAVKEAKKKRSTQKGKFHRIYNRLTPLLKQPDAISDVVETFNDLEKAFGNLEIYHEKYVDLFDSDDEDQVKAIKEVADDMDIIYGEYCDVRSEVNKMNEVKEEKPVTRKESTTIKKPRDAIKLKRLEAPSFGGNIREYPSFKRDYFTHMVELYGDDAFVLKSCLKDDALKLVQAVDHDFDEMIKRLDSKYGRPEKIADSILNDLKRLKKVNEGETYKFLIMVDTVERCWLDLKQMGMAKEMDTATMISHIEKLLPSLQRREWALLIQREDPEPAGMKFKFFLNYLLRERNAMEYMQQDLRLSETSRKEVHHTKSEGAESNGDEDCGVINALQQQLRENQITLNKVVDGLSLVSQVITTSYPAKRSDSHMGKQCWYHNVDNHTIYECAAFKALEERKKFENIRKHGACFNCLKRGHVSRNCSEKKMCEVAGTNGEKCGKYHHPILHPVGESMSYNCNIDDTSVLLMVSLVRSYNMPITTLWDPGANVSLITHEAARRLGLRGEPVYLNITKVGNVTDHVKTKKYTLPLTDMKGTRWDISAYGIDEVTGDVKPVNVEKFVGLFPNITRNDIERPAGKVDLLIGTDYCKMLPIVVGQAGNLQLLKNQFGYCIRGYHSNSVSNVQINMISSVNVEICNSVIKESRGLEESIKNFLCIEGLGIQVHPSCGRCGCGKCGIGTGAYTIKEEREMHLIDEGLLYDEKEHRFTIIYPWLRSPDNLPNNFKAALARLQSTQRRLAKLGEEYMEKYDSQIKNMLDRNVAKVLSNEELDEYKGPIHYIPHHEILKPESKSTPLRVVFDSSSSYMGHSLNSYWAKGPCILNDLLGVLLRFRQEGVGLIGDISKMYNSIKLSGIDQHTHRFLWGTKPDHYILLNVPFGDRPSGTIAILALQKTAEMSKFEHPKERDMLLKDTYVDDILISVESVTEAKEIAKNIDEILDKGGFTVKHWIISGKSSALQMHDEVNGKINFFETDEKVLGIRWNPTEDTFSFKAKVNFSPTKRGISEGSDLKKEDIESNVPIKLTRRMALSQISKIFDPIGLITPFTLEAKLLMREVFAGYEKKDWDDPVSTESRELWITFFKKLFQIELLTFPRSVKAKVEFTNPTLVIFSDASNIGYGACAYVRGQVGPDDYKSCLLTSKNRIAPTRMLSTPRLELCGAVVASRLRKKIELEMDFSFCRIIHILDSSIVFHQIQKESYGFATFVAVRIGEIQSNTDPTEWWWTPSGENPADMLTRLTPIEELGTGSVWQNGPEYMRLPFEEWPISKQCSLDAKDLPDKIKIALSAHKTVTEAAIVPSLQDFSLKNYHDVNKLHKVTSLLILIGWRKTIKGIWYCISPNVIYKAQLMWVKYAQSEILKDWMTRFKNLAPAMNKDGIIVVGKRMSKWLMNNWNRQLLILLPAKHPYTNLLVLTAHEEEHEGIETTLEKIRRDYWIPQARKLLRGIKRKCVKCRLKEKQLEGQEMGNLPEKRLIPSPPFYHTAVDIFGPFIIKGTVNKRSRGKAYGILFNCVTSRAVYIDIAVGYDTDSFLIVLRRFVTIRGYSKTMFSDSGTQLVAASKELKEIVEKWDWDKIAAFGINQGMEWEFTKAADAPWENGCSESLIKLAKRNILSSVGTHILSFPELQTVMFEIANLMNERPIGTKTNDPNEGNCCCPNDLLMGRASNKVPPGQWDVDANTKRRWQFVQMIANTFWRKWMRDYFHTLLIRRKWHTEKRNLRVGDIVLVQDTNSIRGNWRLAQVLEGKEGADGKVRDVLIRYKIQNSSLEYKGTQDTVIRRSAHRLVVVLPKEEQSVGST